MSTELAQLACDRYEIADALHRFGFGLDHGDADSFASALSEDCLFDFKPAGAKLGINYPRLVGRGAIVESVLPLIGPLDTSHTVSNLQIEISGDSATLYAYVMCQHFMPREGSRRGSENALLMNRYDCELVRDGQKWRFKRITIDNAWMQGDPGNSQRPGRPPGFAREIEAAELTPCLVCDLERLQFCDVKKEAMVTSYGKPDFGGKGWCCFRRGEQAEHCVGDRQGLGVGGSAVDLQLSG